MSNRIALLLICAAAIGCAKEPKTADTKMADSKMTDPKMAGCQSGNSDSSVAACTILIDSTAGNDSSRAEALQLRGNAYRNKGDYDKAIQDYNRAITLKPGSAGTLNSRGIAWQFKGNLDSAMSSFNQALKINPNHPLALKNRGRTEFFAGQFTEAAADLEKGLKLDSTNAAVAIWLHVAHARAGVDDAGAFATSLQRTDSVAWPAVVGRYYLGRATEAQLLADAGAAPRQGGGDQRCAAHFYLGENAMIKHLPAEAATHFDETVASCPKDATEYVGAVAELGRLHPH